jgi:Dyp-type peroxidase family
MPDQNASIQLAGITNLSLIAPLKTGFIDSFEALTQVARLQLVLNTLNGIRLAARESTMPLSPFPDPVGRFDIVHFFRFAIIPPDAEARQAGSDRHRLLLSVTFDGGWEPYMRVIWRDLGTLLDLMLCHCEGYPLAHANPCEVYLKWVRDHEVKGGFFYAEAATTVLDQRLMKGLVTPQGLLPPPTLNPATLIALASRLLPAERHQIAATALRAIRTFHALKNSFPDNAAGDEGILRRGMNDVLREVRTIGLSRLLSPGDGLYTLYGPVIEWFDRPGPALPATTRPATPLPLGDIQSGILSSPTDTTHGALVLMRVSSARHALETLARWPVSTEAQGAEPARLRLNVALTYPGLKALKLPAERLAHLPKEFIDGMDARAGLLGDLHGQHPDRWRPPCAGLSAVHVVVQLRAHFAEGVRKVQAGTLHPGLRAEIERLQAPDTGLKVLAVEPMHRRFLPGETVPREHFGFQDGFSQPDLAPDPTRTRWSDTVSPGELLLGYPNDRGDARVPAQPDALLDNGSFLVIRKLAQQVARLDQLIRSQCQALQALHGANAPDEATLKALMMGRGQDGTPLAAPGATGSHPNDFDYTVPGAPASLPVPPTEKHCPFQSHVRRANPRTPTLPRAPLPRIARRGMSYGPEPAADGTVSGERGLFFMAYNASIAEQFEVIQRWISGGNISGRLSWQSDPFLGVPVPGMSRQFQFTWRDQPMSINLGPDPLVELRWGLYLFAPSITALRTMKQWTATPSPTPSPTPAPPAPPTDFAFWQNRLEDPGARDAAWALVRAQPGGVLRTEYGVLVGSKAGVQAVFLDPGQRYSVQGYGERMRASVGLGYLGQDGDSGHEDIAPAVNLAIERIREDQAYDETYQRVAARLQTLRTALPPPEAALGVPIDLPELCEAVLGQLCTGWFGLPDPQGVYMTVGPWDTAARTTPTCPGHFVSASKFIFSPRPGEPVRQHGRHQGRLLRETVTEFLRQQPATAFGPLTRDIVAALGGGVVTAANADLLGRTVTGIMLGFGPTVLGNLRVLLYRWVSDRGLWDLQAALREQPGAPRQGGDPPRHAYMAANACLRKPLIEALMGRPTPDMVWRTVRDHHELMGTRLREGDRVIVGIGSATQADLLAGQRDVCTAFGGSRTPGDWPGAAAPLHACPGYSMGMGVMLGLLAALLDAGTLQATASPNTLKLIP